MFQFKQFTIRQDQTAMKVGTDGVLLGAWAEVEKAHQILDIGTGTGLIALMAAQRNHQAYIQAIEIEQQAYEQACQNVCHSPWSDRIEVIHSSLQSFEPENLFDCIICNPPFFNHSLKTPHNNRNLARHSDSLSHKELLIHASRLLSPNGHFHVILPVTEAKALTDIAPEYQLYPTRITQVFPTPEKAAKRLLIQFSHQQTIVQQDNLVVEITRHQYSEEYIRLTQDFYLFQRKTDLSSASDIMKI